jgi:hypothetical protein
MHTSQTRDDGMVPRVGGCTAHQVRARPGAGWPEMAAG